MVGDLHGQYEDFMNILTDPNIGGFPSDDNQMLFNGDLVDRCRMSVEILVVLMVIKIMHPGAVHIVRGNHESHDTNSVYGFHKHLEQDYHEEASELKVAFAELNALPLAAVIEETVFVTHGGLGASVGAMTIETTNEIHRFAEPPTSGPVHDFCVLKVIISIGDCA